MTLTLELSPELGSQIETAARQRGTDARAFVLDAAKRALDDANDAEPQAPVLSPMEAALEQIKANPIKSSGPVDAVADLEELRATRTEELAGGNEADRRARLARLRGSVKGIGPTVDEFLAERQAEARREAGL